MKIAQMTNSRKSSCVQNCGSRKMVDLYGNRHPHVAASAFDLWLMKVWDHAPWKRMKLLFLHWRENSKDQFFNIWNLPIKKRKKKKKET